jgi:formate transporter
VLIWIGVLQKRITLATMLRNWFWVYTGNFLGSILLAYMMYASGLWSYNNYLHGAYALKIAIGKVNLTFYEAFIRGILCNWIVCLAVWMAYAAKDISGKVWGIFFPIMLFITSAFEHSVANMYYLTAGLLAKTVPAIVEASHLGTKVDTLTLQSMFGNLLPVTLGNIVGGALFVGSYYWFCYMRCNDNG